MSGHRYQRGGRGIQHTSGRLSRAIPSRHVCCEGGDRTLSSNLPPFLLVSLKVGERVRKRGREGSCESGLRGVEEKNENEGGERK